MRHFLKFLPPDKRAEAEREYGAPADLPGTPRKGAESSRAKSNRPGAPKPSIKGAREPLDNPQPAPRPKAEFGGLIERRRRVNRPAVGQERRANAYEGKMPGTTVPRGLSIKSFELDRDEPLNSTGSYLRSLDNSAITLADSGIFKADQDDDDRYNPYNKR